MILYGDETGEKEEVSKVKGKRSRGQVRGRGTRVACQCCEAEGNEGNGLENGSAGHRY